MKKIIFSAAVLAAAAFGVIKVSYDNTVISDLTLNNVEQLAQGENADIIYYGKKEQVHCLMCRMDRKNCTGHKTKKCNPECTHPDIVWVK